MAKIEITDLSSGAPGDTYLIMGSKVSLSGKRSIDAKPNANIDGPVEVQTNAYENNRISITGIDWVDDSDTLNYTRILSMLKSKYTGANKVLLKVYLGSSSTPFPDMNGGTVGIPVVLESYTINMSSKDSLNAYMPSISLNFIETN